MCRLQQLVKQKFAESKVLTNISPDEIQALGCAKQCALLKSSKIKSITNDDLKFKWLPNSINLKVKFLAFLKAILRNFKQKIF